MKKSLIISAIAALAAPAGALAQTSFFWNGGDPSANPAGGGTGIWSTTNAWRTVTESGSQGTWAAATGGTNAAILGGTAGTITLGSSGSTNFTGSSLTVNTSGYVITSSSGSRNLVMTGALTTADNVALTLDQNNTNAIWGFGRLALGSGSVLTIQGGATSGNANRVNLTSASSTSTGGSIVLNGAGAGPTGFVGTASGVVLNTNITNNSATSATMLGATSGNSLTYGGILSGSAHLQISAGQAGGAGTTILNNQNTYTGDTYLNTGTNHVFRMGVDNALPSGTTVFFGASAGGGTADNGGSIDLNGQDLSVAALVSTSTTRGIANNTETLSTLMVGKNSGSNTFGGVIGVVTNTNLTTQSNAIALVKTGSSTQVLTGSNTYSGGTTINDGTLALSGSGTIGSGNLAFGGGTLDITGISLSSYTMATGTTVSGNGTIDASGKEFRIAGSLNPGNSPGTLNVLGDLTLESSSISNFEINGITAGLYDFVNVSGTLTFGGILNLTTGYAAGLGDSIQIFQAGAFDDSFASITGANIGGGLSWSFNAANGTLTVVPEPNSMALIGLGAMFILARRKWLRKA